MPKYVLNPETLLYEEREDPKYLKPLRLSVAILAAAGFVFLSNRDRNNTKKENLNNRLRQTKAAMVLEQINGKGGDNKIQ